MNMKKIAITLVVLVIVFIGGYYAYTISKSKPEPVVTETPRPEPKLLSKVSFICKEGKIMEAGFYEYPEEEGQPTATPPPQPRGIVRLSLIDGRTFELKQTVSADGARYADEKETFVLWNKGNGAMVQENGAEKDYKGCVILASTLPNVRLPIPFVNTDAKFSLRLPSLKTDTADGFSVDESFTHVLTPSSTILGVRFTIPVATASGTNLSTDTYMSIEHLPDATTTCNANMFLEGRHSTTTTNAIEDGVAYSIASTTDAGAGNRYEDTVYAIPDSNPCIAVRYLIHYTALENHASGTVKAFDRDELLATFNHIRHSITLNF